MEGGATLEENTEKRTKEISDAKTYLENLLKNVRDLVYVHDARGYITFANRATLDITGYTREEILGMSYRKLTTPKYVKAIKKKFKEKKETMVPQYELEIVTKAGERIPVDVRATIIEEDGEIAGAIAVGRDLREARRHAQEVKEARDFLGSILQSSADAIVSLDGKGVVTFASKGAEDMFGYKKESWIGTHISKYYAKGMEEAKKLKKLVEEKGKLENYETDFNAKDGRIISAIVSASFLRDINGKIMGTLGVAKDITERKKLYNELERTKDFLENIIQSSIDGITSVDRKGNISFASKGSNEMLGYTEEERVGTHVSLYYLNGMEEAKRIMNLVREKGRLQNYEISLIAKDGRIVPISASISLLKDKKGEMIGTLGVYKDITEKKRLEEEIRRRSDEMENFVHTISHDLKSPLVSLQGFASILRSDYGDKIDKDGHHYLERIEKNANHMETLIKDLLELSRVGRVVGAFEEVDSSKIIDEVIEGLRLQIDQKGISLIIHNHCPTIYCDKNRVRQVFENLISNALKFIDNTENPTIEVGGTDCGEAYEFYVKDNGIGIERRYHEKIFGIFQRLQDLKDVEGTGVGLAIVKRIIENHDGDIRVESDKGKGATFYLTFPKKR